MMQRMQNWVVTNMPTREGLAGNKYLKPFAGRILRSELWRFNRRSVPRGVALGMLAAVFPVAQTLVAAVFALPVRANVPIAVLTTFLTNPITTPFLLAAAYKVGQWTLRIDSLTYGRPLNAVAHSDHGETWMEWLTGNAGLIAMNTGVGLVIIAIVSAAVGYLVASFGWRWWIARKWRQRAKRRDKKVNAESGSLEQQDSPVQSG